MGAGAGGKVSPVGKVHIKRIRPFKIHIRLFKEAVTGLFARKEH